MHVEKRNDSTDTEWRYTVMDTELFCDVVVIPRQVHHSERLGRAEALRVGEQLIEKMRRQRYGITTTEAAWAARMWCR
jgi:hypothetical protein